MSVPRVEVPPTDGGNYIIPQLGGELISIPGSKSTFRILASARQTDGAMSVFSSGSVLADAPGFHHHNEAHDIFLVTKGYMKLWNGDKCKIMGPGDFASVPPGIVHNPMWLGPHTETYGLVTPGEWVDFFRYISEEYNGIILPEFDHRNLVEILIPKVMAARGKYDVVFHPKHQGCEISDWNVEDEKIPEVTEPFFLRANTGPRWILGGVMSRPFVTTKQSNNKFAISSIESSSKLGTSALEQRLTFPNVHHLFTVFEGTLEVTVSGCEPCEIREGETIFLAAKTTFSLKFKSRFVRFWSFSSGDGIETLIKEAGEPFKGFVIPEEPVSWDESKFKEMCKKLNDSLPRVDK